VVKKEIIKLASIFGGDPEDAGQSGKQRRYEHDDILDELPHLLSPNELPVSVSSSAEGIEYGEAYAAFNEQLEYLRNVIASRDQGVAQIMYNLTLCNQARDRLLNAAKAEPVAAAFEENMRQLFDRLKAAERPLPVPLGG
jgi:hypothetical protein